MSIYGPVVTPDDNWDIWRVIEGVRVRATYKTPSNYRVGQGPSIITGAMGLTVPVHRPNV